MHVTVLGKLIIRLVSVNLILEKQSGQLSSIVCEAGAGQKRDSNRGTYWVREIDCRGLFRHSQGGASWNTSPEHWSYAEVPPCKKKEKLEIGVSPGIVSTKRDGYGRLVLGDIITSVNGKKVANGSDLYRILDQCKVGEKVTVEVLRGDHVEKIPVLLEPKLDET
ncbi:hypothetical protein L2E82_40266 [Cichorium intybus]|uniref:Uncharacterized protein n=1 Tax=Cichorium intybus TaxID=13427 RepID=A0ACB9ALA2_CICIN|nr:hypothetical protein L2E82_40266 [Cichorium intybus]